MAIRYFIPDWDDRVDPNYNFERDQHTPKRDPYRDDRYAHELYPMPPYDGILLSRAVLDASPAKRQAIREAGSVHRYLRLPANGQYQVLGDCGAFSYWQQEQPPYDTRDVLDYYEDLRFDLGVSVDHLIFTELESEKERRWQITIENAKEFLHLYNSGSYNFIPIGVAQGWDAASYQRAVYELMQMGYRHIAIGGLVRSQTTEILQILEAINKVLKPNTQVHLFGVNRPEHIHTFAKLGVTSFDSASRLRRAWMDGRRNYFLGNDAYTAIRVPEAHALAKKYHLDATSTRYCEQRALEALRAFDKAEIGVDQVYQAVIEYAGLAGKLSDRTRQDYQLTLRKQPWKQCPCQICKDLGVEVIIFRGNNRNRRRGFHNTWQLYQQLRHITPDAADATHIKVPLQTEQHTQS